MVITISGNSKTEKQSPNRVKKKNYDTDGKFQTIEKIIKGH